MQDVTINYLAVLVAGLSSMVVGSIWYSKGVFGKKWMALMGFKDEDMKQGAGKAMGAAITMSLLLAYVLAHVLAFSGANSAWLGVQTALWVWLGFVVTSHVTNAAFNKYNMSVVWLFLMNQLVTLLVMGAILGAWM